MKNKTGLIKMLGVVCAAILLSCQLHFSRAADQISAQSNSLVDNIAIEKTITSLAPQGWAASDLLSQIMPINLSNTGVELAVDSDVLQMLNEFHCSNIFSKTFQRGQRKVSLQVFCFADPLGAYAAYTALRKGASTVVTRGDGSSEDDQSISFWQGNYFVRLVTTAEDDDEAKELVRSLADSLAPVIPGHAHVPFSITSLPGWGKIAGSERLIMGPVSARRLISFPLVGQLELGKSYSAVAVDYQFSQPNPERMRLLVVDYGNHNFAANTFHQYVQSLESSHKYEYTGSSCLVKMADGNMLCFHKGRYLVLIAGARKRISPYMLAKQLDYYVAGDSYNDKF